MFIRGLIMQTKDKSVTILHTSDWHLGRNLYGRQRIETYNAYLVWLIDTIKQKEVDILLVAGDVFDTTTPGNRAQTLYYQFLHSAASSGCRHIVITGGNHDSPTFLEAPRALLRVLDVHVVGSISDNPDDEVLVLNDQSGEPELIVCAVPYLRDRDIRVVESGESMEDKERKMLEGIRQHYKDIAVIAKEKNAALPDPVPIIAMGHLFTAGGRTSEGDGVRELYVGSLAHVSSDIFSDVFDYVALGHLHIAQKVGDHNHIRYSGSPVAMGFNEAGQSKSVCLVSITNRNKNLPDRISNGDSTSNVIAAQNSVADNISAQHVNDFQYMTTVQALPVPIFQKMIQLRGDLTTLLAEISIMADTEESIWLELIYEGAEIVPDLREKLEEATHATKLEILRIKNIRVAKQIIDITKQNETLDDLTELDVFKRCLSVNEIGEPHLSDLLRLYQETVNELYEEDVSAQ